MVAVKRSQKANPQLTLQDFVRTPTRSTARWACRHIDLVAFSIKDLAASKQRNRASQVGANILEVLVYNATFFEGELNLLLTVSAESVVAWGFREVSLRQLLEPIDLVLGSAGPALSSALWSEYRPCIASKVLIELTSDARPYTSASPHRD